MADNFTFQRIEKKYLLNKEQYEVLFIKLKPYMEPDRYGLHTICNIYYDTEQYDLIRTSIEKPPYKEKLRLRSYGVPGMRDRVFVDIKKKWDGVVYKRRIAMNLMEAKACLEQGQPILGNGQIGQEVDYFIKFYHPKPKLYIAYDREAYVGREDENLRITFDKNIRSRKKGLKLELGDEGERLLEDDWRLMEIKISRAFPMWLAAILSELSIYPVSFSKYGAIYKQQLHSMSDKTAV